jgi:hypothetical protein
MVLLVTHPTLWRVFCIIRCLDIRPDVCHREALVFFACTLRAFPEILFGSIQFILLSTVKAYILARPDFLSGFSYFFGQLNHQFVLWE